MKKSIFTLALLFVISVGAAQTNYVRLSSSKGDIVVMLYDSTPKHRDNFLEVISNGLLATSTFNRVIPGFVSQGGELDDTILDREKLHPEEPLQRVPAEIRPELFHKRGTLGAGRNDNPEKSSYLNQIYLVEGKLQTDESLDLIEAKTGKKYTAQQRKEYKTIGGIPRLDGDYTVFGEIVSGLAVAHAINFVPTDSKDLPLSPLKFSLHILTKNEISALARK